MAIVTYDHGSVPEQLQPVVPGRAVLYVPLYFNQGCYNWGYVSQRGNVVKVVFIHATTMTQCNFDLKYAAEFCHRLFPLRDTSTELGPPQAERHVGKSATTSRERAYGSVMERFLHTERTIPLEAWMSGSAALTDVAETENGDLNRASTDLTEEPEARKATQNNRLLKVRLYVIAPRDTAKHFSKARCFFKNEHLLRGFDPSFEARKVAVCHIDF